MGQVIFITATDTGAGKTLLTAMCVAMLLEMGRKAIAIKPFCSASHKDVGILYHVQKGRIPRDVINPNFIKEPVAPLVGLRRSGRVVSMDSVNRHIDELERNCDWLLIEGAGGLLTPLGEGYDLEELIVARKCRVLVVTQNRLGAINHSRLTINSLSRRVSGSIALVVMENLVRDLACRTNLTILPELLHPVPVHPIPFLGPRATQSAAMISALAKKKKKSLARIVGAASLSTALAQEREVVPDPVSRTQL